MLEFLTGQKFLFPASSTWKGPGGFCGTCLACAGLSGKGSNTWMEEEGLYSSTSTTLPQGEAPSAPAMVTEPPLLQSVIKSVPE